MNLGLQRVFKALGYSLQGLKTAWDKEIAFKQEVIVFIFAVILSFSFNFETVERFLLIFSVLLILIVELINSAIEAVVDRIGAEIHELSGRAKDYGSASVFLTILVAVIIWITLFYQLFSE